jgi:hypothetical protein
MMWGIIQIVFMVKLTGSQEFISGSANQPMFKFFSVDTNTIYPPVLEFRWDDFTTSSGAPTEISTSDLSIALDENPGIFYSESINRFRLNVRPTYLFVPSKQPHYTLLIIVYLLLHIMLLKI